jgi:hypothetical protein
VTPHIGVDFNPRNVVLVLLAVLLSFALVLVGGSLVLNVSGVGELFGRTFQVRDQREALDAVLANYRDPLKMMDNAFLLFVFVVPPLTAAVIGLFIGVFARGKVWPLTTFGLAPVIFALGGKGWQGYLSAGVSLLVASLVGSTIAAWRRNRPRGQSPP